MKSPIANTIEYLTRCREMRAVGFPVYRTNDPTWLVDMAINRRAGEADDPFGYCTAPLNHRGKYPRFATAAAQATLLQRALAINSPRVRVYPSELGEWRRYLTRKLPGRFADPNE